MYDETSPNHIDTIHQTLCVARYYVVAARFHWVWLAAAQML